MKIVTFNAHKTDDSAQLYATLWDRALKAESLGVPVTITEDELRVVLAWSGRWDDPPPHPVKDSGDRLFGVPVRVRPLVAERNGEQT